MEENNKNNEPLNKDFKVPKLRFKKYSNIYNKSNIGTLFTIQNGLNKDKKSFGCGFPIVNYMDVNKNVILNKNQILGKVNVNNDELKIFNVKNSDVLITRTSETLDEIAFSSCVIDAKENLVFSGFLLKLSPIKHNLYSPYLAYLFRSPKYRAKMMRYSTITSRALINSKNLSKITIQYPNLDEQKNIYLLMCLTEDKIKVLDRKILALKKYKEGLIKTLIKNGNNEGYLSEHVVVEEKTRLPSSFGKPCGSYPFFINNDEKIEKYCDSYIFDGTYLILNTGGCASIKFYKGKFSAMSDCLVLKPKRNPTGLYFFLKAEDKKINQLGFQGTGLRHLDQNWLFRQMVCLPPISEDILECLNDRIDQKISTIEKKIKLCEKIKDFLLVNMFI